MPFHPPHPVRPSRVSVLRTLPVLLALAGLWPPAALAAEGGGSARTRWPLDLPDRFLTSNFMEYRPGRFHAGLDLKTQTVTGFPVRAVEDGWIARLRATPTAYGRAVYLRGDSGRTYVFAHLERFNDDLRARLDAQRARTGTYRARLSFRPDEIRVRRGDVLGLTGQSGTNGPHLHFEVRDARNRPVDPQAEGFAVPDTIAPVIAAVRAWPVDAEARIEGAAVEHVLARSGGLSGPQPTLHVAGPVAFSARIVELSDIRGHRLEPAEIEVWLDGTPVHTVRNEGYAFAENGLQRLEWAVVPGVRERWLHRHPANTLTGREGGLWHLGPDGRGLAPGRHELRLRARDRAGNTAEAILPVVAGGDAVPAGAVEGWRPDRVSPVIASPDSTAMITVSPFFDTPHPAVHAAYPGLQRLVFRPDAGDPVQAPLVVYARPVRADSVQRRAAADQGLRFLGSVQEFVAGAWPISASLPVPMPEAREVADAATRGLYRWHGGSWAYVDVWPTADGGEAAVRIDEPGLHAALADRTPPRIGVPAQGAVVRTGPVSDVPGVTLPRWEVLPVPIRDLGAGLAVETLAVLLDGRPLIVEPDLPRDRVLVTFPDATPPGRHRLEIAVADEAGNRAAADFEIDLSE